MTDPGWVRLPWFCCWRLALDARPRPRRELSVILFAWSMIASCFMAAIFELGLGRERFVRSEGRGGVGDGRN